MEEAIPVMRVVDATRAVAWYGRLGYEQEWEYRFEPGFPAFVSIARRAGSRIFLSEHTGDATPNSLVYLRLDSIEAVAREFDTDIIEQPWGRELHLTDVDGNQLRIGGTASDS